jgi:hypothetical protein
VYGADTMPGLAGRYLGMPELRRIDDRPIEMVRSAPL